VTSEPEDLAFRVGERKRSWRGNRPETVCKEGRSPRLEQMGGRRRTLIKKKKKKDYLHLGKGVKIDLDHQISRKVFFPSRNRTKKLETREISGGGLQEGK